MRIGPFGIWELMVLFPIVLALVAIVVAIIRANRPKIVVQIGGVAIPGRKFCVKCGNSMGQEAKFCSTYGTEAASQVNY